MTHQKTKATHQKRIKAGLPILFYILVVVLLKLFAKSDSKALSFSKTQYDSLITLSEKKPYDSLAKTSSFSLAHKHIQQIDSTHQKTETRVLTFSKRKKHLRKNAPQSTYNLNSVDSSQLISIYGIGSIYAKRIIKYRQRLGGFISIGQLKEIYGMNNENYERIKDALYIHPKFQPERIDFFACSFKELLSHPYCDYPMTKILFNFKGQWLKRYNKKDSTKYTRSYFKNLLFNLHAVELKKLAKLHDYLKFNPTQ